MRKNLALILGIIISATSCAPYPMTGEYKLAPFYGIFENSEFKSLREDANASLAVLRKYSYYFSEYAEDKKNSVCQLTVKKLDTIKGVEYLVTTIVSLSPNKNLQVKCIYSRENQTFENPDEKQSLERDIFDELNQKNEPKRILKKW